MFNKIFNYSLFLLLSSLICFLVLDSKKVFDLARDSAITKRLNVHPKTDGIDPVIRIINVHRRYSCTAFIIDDNYAITAAHCLNASGSLADTSFSVYSSNKSYLTFAKGVAYDTRSDIGLISGDFSKFSALPIELTYEVPLNFLMWAVGYPRGTSSVIANSYVGLSRVETYVRGQSQIIFGMSGGPIINPKTGKAVAVISAIDKQGYSYVQPLQGLLGIFPELE